MWTKINWLAINFFGYLSSLVFRGLRLGVGGTWPGHLVLKIKPGYLKTASSQLRRGVILVTGTNGKTTTASLLTNLLRAGGFRVIHNPSGANLANGLVSAFLAASPRGDFRDFDGAVFEVDEGALPGVLGQVSPQVVLLLNLSRDQLDRFGEIDITGERWQEGLRRLNPPAAVFYYRGDRRLAKLARRLTHRGSSPRPFDHQTPQGFPSPLPGSFNQLNTNAAVAAAQFLGVADAVIVSALADFSPAFGRGEEINFRGRAVRLLLAKNPASFDRNLKLLSQQPPGYTVVLVLNDHIPDGRDVSWIYDIRSSLLNQLSQMAASVWVSGRRAGDLVLRLKLAGVAVDRRRVDPRLGSVLKKAAAEGSGPIYLLPTYSAMLAARRILRGRRIL